MPNPTSGQSQKGKDESDYEAASFGTARREADFRLDLDHHVGRSHRDARPPRHVLRRHPREALLAHGPAPLLAHGPARLLDQMRKMMFPVFYLQVYTSAAVVMRATSA